ncbi:MULTISPECIES: hypothetical protein [unclassified Streptomyces]|uniref:hypothetical protein n=1 Tax=unclassified Streptomyces TaxID=2593676 RepID=UPI000881728E|nr:MULTISPECIES: hypothetical protein [unclassified Streptomyces]PBC72300.1 hypothetical protein BX261_7384 [Streptomyces sp. 2321.6]SDR62253.1 hypothetical protein SAMN05216511_7319 [Streptomyces sp. KS_16]SEE51364.1 hypothetical protein SAMN05428940_7368 [Streptomyces sp. 2133.1]SNC77804.1 hypothetical protein SAMN06272741_7220 [Streptomyces sp. 2114.4]
MTDDLRQRIASAMAEAAGSRAFRNTDPAWNHMRSIWLAHADAALGSLRPELKQLRTRAWKAERAVNLLAGSHRRAEQAEATIARAAERLAVWEQRLPETVKLAPIIETVRRDLGIEEASCAECGHPKDQHQDADEPVSVGLCTVCDQAGSDDAWHNYEPQEQQ